MWWWIVAQVVIAVVNALFFQPKPQKPPTQVAASTFEHPEPREGETIKVVFGTRDIKDANLVWFGNFRAVEIRKSAGGGGGKKG